MNAVIWSPVILTSTGAGDRFWGAAGTTTEDRKKIAELEREVRELCRANDS
jgi:hypothetical protein